MTECMKIRSQSGCHWVSGRVAFRLKASQLKEDFKSNFQLKVMCTYIFVEAY